MDVMLKSGPRSASNPELDALIDAVLAGSSTRIEQAEGLPAAAYVSQAFFDLEIEQIFRPEWTCVGHVSEIPNVGDYFTTDMYGKSLVVVRGPDRIRVLSRICLHRWAFVVSGRGNTKSFTCPFHNWGYALDGRLTAPTYMHRAENFDIASCRLPEIRSEIVEELGLIFITFAEEIDSISERLVGLSERLANFHMKDLVAVAGEPSNSNFNWKFQIETGVEAYHHFGTHRHTLEPAYPTRLSWCEEESKNGWSVSHSPRHPDVEIATLPRYPDVSVAELDGNDFYLIYPALRFGIYPDRIRVRLINPVAPDRSSSRAFYLLTPEVAAQTERLKQDFASKPPAGPEDNIIDLMQQAAAKSRLVRGGRLSHLEATAWHLAEYVRARLRALR